MWGVRHIKITILNDKSENVDFDSDVQTGVIASGVVSDISAIAFHGSAPLLRIMLAGKGMLEECQKHIAAHIIDTVESAPRKYCLPHRHNCGEINLVLSLTELTELTYQIQLGSETFIVKSPASIFIPAGVLHSANVLSGSGVFVVIVDTDDYDSSLIY